MEDTYTLLKLPNDILGIIIKLIPHDKVYLSITSKLLNQMCKNYYDTIKNKDKHPKDNAYDLNLWLKEFGQANFKTYVCYWNSDINILIVLSKHAMDNGYLYGAHLHDAEYKKHMDYDKFEKITGIYPYNHVENERNKYEKTIGLSLVKIFDEYCKFDVLNKYTIFISKILILYYEYTYFTLSKFAFDRYNKNKKIYKYFNDKYNNECKKLNL